MEDLKTTAVDCITYIRTYRMCVVCICHILQNMLIETMYGTFHKKLDDVRQSSVDRPLTDH